MEEQLKRYRVVVWPAVSVDNRDPLRLFEDRLNNLAEFGYKVRDFQGDYALLELSEPSKYENIEKLADVKPYDVDEYLAKGWVVVDTWKDFVRMVKKK